MAWQTLKYQLTSSSDMLFHNGQMANPLNKWAKLMKQISSRRAKTDADHEEIARIEFLASLYMAADGPVIPAEVLDAVLINGAKKSKEGMTAKSGAFCLEHARLEYDGPRTADELWADERFRHISIVRVGQAKVVRTRPIFNKWSAIVSVNIETGIVNPARVDDWLTIAGTQVGIGDWRPQHGRFQAQRL
jgi:tetrahydrodipicolinate N-succinyltransferase